MGPNDRRGEDAPASPPHSAPGRGGFNAHTASQAAAHVWSVLEPQTRDFYLRSMDALDQAGVPYLVGGAYALAFYAGIVRHTKDFDVFCRAEDAPAALKALEKSGCRTELTFPHWLGKAFEVCRPSDNGNGAAGAAADDPAFVDVIYRSGNGLCRVDEDWFKHAADGEVLGRPAKLCPAEEIVWSKSFVQERERFDGADINHLILSRGHEFDWRRLIARYQGGHERVLLAHVVMFGYVFPSERSQVPEWVFDELTQRAKGEPAAGKVCRGTCVSRSQYLIDIGPRGYEDARLEPRGPMTAKQIAQWTAAIDTIR